MKVYNKRTSYKLLYNKSGIFSIVIFSFMKLFRKIIAKILV